LISVLLASILNAIRQHYGVKYHRIVPVIDVALEAVAILTSKGTVNGVLPGALGKLKLPLQDVPPVGASAGPAKPSAITAGLLKLMLLMGLVVGVAGCASTWKGDITKGLSVAQTAGDTLFTRVRPAYQTRWRAAASACKVPLEQCPGYVACDGERRQVFAAFSALQSGIDAMGRAVPKIEGVLR